MTSAPKRSCSNAVFVLKRYLYSSLLSTPLLLVQYCVSCVRSVCFLYRVENVSQLLIIQYISCMATAVREAFIFRGGICPPCVLAWLLRGKYIWSSEHTFWVPSLRIPCWLVDVYCLYQWFFIFTNLATHYADLQAFGKPQIFAESRKQKSASRNELCINC